MKSAAERRFPTLLIMLLALGGIALAVAMGRELRPMQETGWQPIGAAEAEPHSSRQLSEDHPQLR